MDNKLVWKPEPNIARHGSHRSGRLCRCRFPPARWFKGLIHGLMDVNPSLGGGHDDRDHSWSFTSAVPAYPVGVGCDSAGLGRVVRSGMVSGANASTLPPRSGTSGPATGLGARKRLATWRLRADRFLARSTRRLALDLAFRHFIRSSTPVGVLNQIGSAGLCNSAPSSS